MLNALDQANGLWEATGELRLAPGFYLPARMTVARLPDGALWVHSPIALDDALAAELDALGPVRHLVAPNCLHHFFLARAHRRYPQAAVHIAPGLAAKRPRLAMGNPLSATPPPEWGDAFAVCPLEGARRLGETVFLHRPSRTLICTDLVFNLRTWRGPLTGLLLRLFGTRGRLAASRLVRLVVDDRERFRASLREVARWDFQRVAMAHGEVLEGPTARADFLTALEARFGGGLGDAG